MKMAKASAEDIKRVTEFFRFIEEFMEYGTHTPENDEYEEDSIDLTDKAFVEKLREMWGHPWGPTKVDAAWPRVLMGYQILIDTACDPDADTLEWKPELAKKLADPEGLEEALEHLRGNKDKFRAVLTDTSELLASMCDYADRMAKKKRLPAWSIIGDITSHGSGVSSAIYELYSRKPAAVSSEGSTGSMACEANRGAGLERT